MKRLCKIRTDRSHSSGDVSVILAEGYLDFDAAPALKESLVSQIGNGAHHLIVDLTGAIFIDSTSIGVLVGALKRIRDANGTMSVVCTNEDIRSVFEIVGLDDLILMRRSRDEALSAISGSV